MLNAQAEAGTESAVVRVPAAEAEARPETGTPFTLRAVLLALLFSVLGIAWAMQCGLVTQTVYVAGSVPPIPALTVLLLLVALNPVLRRRGFSQGEMLLIYIFVGIAAAVADGNSLLTYFFAYILVPRYAPSASSSFAEQAKQIPAWFAPSSVQALKDFCEGHAPIPWREWLPPLFYWSTFFVALWVTLYALLRLFRDRWIQQEHLRFPIVDLALNLTPGESEIPRLFRNRLLWVGVGLAALFNGTNIAQMFDPGLPALGRYVDLGAAFTQPPWSALSPAWISFRPEIVGIGYLMNTDVLFTAWFSYVAMRLCSVAATAMGYEVNSGYYDYGEIATGAYLGILCALLFAGRGSLGRALHSASEALARRAPGDPDYAAWKRNITHVGVAAVGFAYMVWWGTRAGMAWWIGALFVGLLIAFALVYARIRAETGAPILYLFPFWQQQNFLLNLFGSSAMSGGASLAALASLGFLARGTFPQLSAYQIEAMEIGRRARVRPRHLAACVLLALPFGLLVGYAFFLMHSYHYGFYTLDGGTGHGGGRVMMATMQYQQLAQWRSQLSGPNIPLLIHTLLGFGLVGGMGALRSAFPGSPFHPLGFAMGASYGFHLWAPFLAVWLCKLLVLKAGGSKLYRRFIPLFFGIILGHYLTVGILWGLIALVNPQLARMYTIHFG
ncbi:MAG TPA: DUF6785 family protein [Chthonomonadaceae bacterium]|nr:DUF6785 family protein [Chthonomonadaceae bacterium]